MCNLIKSVKSFSQCNLRFFLLVGTFVFGFSLGIVIAFHNTDLYSSLMLEAAHFSTSTITILAHIILPFLLTALIYNSGKRLLFLVVCFLQSFVFGISSGAVNIAYEAAQWLICSLLLFTSITSLVALMWFWIQHISAQNVTSRKDYFLCFCIAILAAGLDYYVISPFLMHLYS